MNLRSISFLGAVVALHALAALPAAAQSTVGPCPATGITLTGTATQTCVFSEDTLTFGNGASASFSGTTVTLNQGWIFVVSPPQGDGDVEKIVSVSTSYGTAGAGSDRTRPHGDAAGRRDASSTTNVYMVYLTGTAGSLTSGTLALVSGSMASPPSVVSLAAGCLRVYTRNQQGQLQYTVYPITGTVVAAVLTAAPLSQNLSGLTCSQ